jgi:putative endonuclease
LERHDRIAIGRMGEDEAVRVLKKSGYRVLKRNYRCRYGEIDIIAEDKGAIVFIEVKTRGSDAFGTPGEGVDRRKQRHITLASIAYLTEQGLSDRGVRFDVVCIDLLDKGFSTEIVRDAFEAVE